MTVSVPVEIEETITTNVTDDTEVFDNYAQVAWLEGDKVQHDGKIYIADENITVQTYDPIKADYQLGEVVWGEGINPNQVMYATEGEIPKRPPQYTPFDIDPDHTSWTSRYFRITPEGVGVTPTYPYIFTVTKADGFTHEYRFEKTAIETMYVMLIVKDSGGVVKEITDASFRIYSNISNLTTEYVATTQPVVDSSYDSWFPGFIFSDAGGVFVRTTLDDTAAPQETIFVTEAQLFKSVIEPTDIPAFSYLQETNENLPFDKSNYTKAVTPLTTMSYTITATEDFNMFVLGYVKGNTFDYTFSGSGGSGTGVVIDGSRDNSNVLSSWYTTKIIYSNTTLHAGDSVSITIHGAANTIELGTFMIGAYVDAGMTNLTLRNKYKDFSVFEYDPWGNASYTERAKIAIYSGTVDIPITDYDRIDRLMMSLGKSIVVIDGSDNLNNSVVEADTSIFAATQKIGRFMSFDQKTVVKNNDMDVLATYSFTIEEIV